MLEKWGRFCAQIHPLIFALLLALPFLMAGSYFLMRHLRLLELESRCHALYAKTPLACAEAARKALWQKRHCKADPYYLDHLLENTSLLNREKTYLEALQNHPATKYKTPFRERLAFLMSDENRLAFVEESIRQTPYWQESDEKLLHPVQLDRTDLDRLLAALEQPAPQQPQLIICDLWLHKKELPFQNDGFELNLRLLKREPL